MVPTDPQKDIIGYDGNTVVLASPGSGKTFVISEMIKRQLAKDEVHPYQGVIAISYTRKASAHLKRKALKDGVEAKNSFFGTIDSFCLSQIINKFGRYVFGYPQAEVAPLSLYDLTKTEQSKFEWVNDAHPEYEIVDDVKWEHLYELYCKGTVLIEALELMALRVVMKSTACRNYVKARFTHVFIDEYQDADTYTNAIFRKFVSMGLVGTVVGDKNQSIFGFAHKKCKYLVELSQDPSFRAFPLLDNFRGSQSIIDYSSRLLDSNYQAKSTTKNGVIHMTVNGGEDALANYLSKAIPNVCKQVNEKNLSQVAILVKRGDLQKKLNEKLTIPHRLVETTILDRDMNPRSRLYGELLQFYFNAQMSIFSVVDEFQDYEMLTLNERQRLMTQKDLIREVKEVEMLKKLPILFHKVAKILLPQYADGQSLKHLASVMADVKLLNTYRPLSNREVVLMTLHKSKGLEFDIVFHLNMNEWELPGKHLEIPNDFNSVVYNDYEQDLDLHYVGITRARHLCFLISTSHRTNSRGALSKAYPSEFLNMNGLGELRMNV